MSTTLLFKPGEHIQLESEILSWETTTFRAFRFSTSVAISNERIYDDITTVTVNAINKCSLEISYLYWT